MKNKTKIIIIVIGILLAFFFFLIKPYINFKSMEKQVLESAKRYYEINNTQLPTGNKLKTIELKTLYLKDFINSDLKTQITDKKCSLDNSWIKVKKSNNEYQYYTYLECGFFKSNIDHEGPVIKLKGEDEITLYKGEKYKELGVMSVTDNTDKKMNVKEVSIDSSSVNSSKVGVYKVSYKIKDSFNNETIKIRKVKVIETLNHIVEKNTDKSKIYKGTQYNNYIKLDGILFKIVGINSDGSVKLVTNESISAVNYDDVTTWLNDYFYETFSDSAKKYIKKNSKWCNDKITDPNNFKSCKSYTKSNPIGLLSLLDYTNSNKDNNYNITTSSLLYNLKDSNTAYQIVNNQIQTSKKEENILISPSLNIIKNAVVSSGNGTIDSPYVLKGNNKKLKAGDTLDKAKVGEYISYSGYKFRIMEKEDNGNTKIIMDDIIKNNYENFYVRFSDSKDINLKTTTKGNLLYVLVNNVSKYLKTDLFTAQEENYKKYDSQITYLAKAKDNKNKLKVNVPSIYDIFSTTIYQDYWFKEYTNNSYCYMYYQGIAKCSKYDYNDIKGIRVVTYLNKDVTIERGNGLETNPYVIVK